jgi:hypothetical protein
MPDLAMVFALGLIGLACAVVILRAPPRRDDGE